MVPFTVSNTDGLDPTLYPYPAALPPPAGLGFPQSGSTGIMRGCRRCWTTYGPTTMAKERIFLTGMSGGGLLAWHTVLTRPEELFAASLAAPNYYPDPGPILADPSRATLPVHVFQGDHDGLLVEMNSGWSRASELCHEKGFGNVSRTIVPGGVHRGLSLPGARLLRGGTHRPRVPCTCIVRACRSV